MDLDALTATERREALQAYLDGELPAPEARAVAAWLADHPDARAEVERLRRLNDLLGAYEDEPVPEGFATHVLSAAGLGRDDARRPAGGRLFVLPGRRLVAAAVLLLALGAGAALLVERARPTVPAPPAETALALESVPPDLLEHADLLLSLTDAEFDAVLALDPEDLPDAGSGG